MSSGKRWASRSRTSRRFCSNQAFVAGVGNIYADEVVLPGEAAPGSDGESLSPEECDRLRQAIEAVLTKGHRVARLDHPRLRRRLGSARRLPERVRGLRPHRRAVPDVQDRDQAHAAGRPLVALLSPMSAGKNQACTDRDKETGEVEVIRFRIVSCTRVRCAFVVECHYVVPRVQAAAGRNQPGAEVPLAAREPACSLLMTGSFWVYAQQTEDLAYEQLETTGRALIPTIFTPCSISPAMDRTIRSSELGEDSLARAGPGLRHDSSRRFQRPRHASPSQNDVPILNRVSERPREDRGIAAGPEGKRVLLLRRDPGQRAVRELPPRPRPDGGSQEGSRREGPARPADRTT